MLKHIAIKFQLWANNKMPLFKLSKCHHLTSSYVVLHMHDDQIYNIKLIKQLNPLVLGHQSLIAMYCINFLSNNIENRTKWDRFQSRI